MTVIDFVRLLRRNLLLLVICAALGAGIALAYVYTRPTNYVATSTGVVVAGDSASVGGAMSGNSVAQQRANAYVTLIDTRAVSDRVTQQLEAVGDPGAQSGELTATVVKDTSFIQVTGTGTTAQRAQNLANAGLQALIAEALRMETYGQAGDNASDDELEALTTIHVLNYDPATLPSAPSRANMLRMVLLGVAAGLILGSLIAVARRQFDVKVRTREDVEQQTGHAVLGVIPDTRDLKHQRDSGDLTQMGHAGEALRQLRTNLRFANIDNPPRAVVITSANSGEGKSTISSNLARLIAKSGQDVVLVDCDLRRPTQAKAFSADTEVGLTQVLAGDIEASDALVDTDLARLKLLPAGSIPPNPSELIGSRRMQILIATLAQDAFVILDAPPMLAVTDAGLLAADSDGALLVTSVGHTYKDQVGLCSQQLEQVGAVLLGSVLNRVPRKQIGDVLYGYGHGGYGSYESYYDNSGKKKRKRRRGANDEETEVEVGSVGVSVTEMVRASAAQETGPDTSAQTQVSVVNAQRTGRALPAGDPDAPEAVSESATGSDSQASRSRYAADAPDPEQPKPADPYDPYADNAGDR